MSVSLGKKTEAFSYKNVLIQSVKDKGREMYKSVFFTLKIIIKLSVASASFQLRI
jgi:hypothetical protein